MIQFDDELGGVRASELKEPGKCKRQRPPLRVVLVVVILNLVFLNLFWKYQLRYERDETNRRLQKIAAGDAGVRRQAIASIRGLGPYAASPIAAALESQDPKIRRAAILASREVLDICLMELSTMNCVTGVIPGRAAAGSGFETLTSGLTHSLADIDRANRLDAVRVLSRISADEWRETEIAPPKKAIAAVLEESLDKERDATARGELIHLFEVFHQTLGLQEVSGLHKDTGRH